MAAIIILAVLVLNYLRPIKWPTINHPPFVEVGNK